MLGPDGHRHDASLGLDACFTQPAGREQERAKPQFKIGLSVARLSPDAKGGKDEELSIILIYL